MYGDSRLLPPSPLLFSTLMSTTTNLLQRRGIHKLPLELLVEIFKLASEGQRVPPSHRLITLSHVCVSWRTAMRGAPQLWTTICGVETPSMIREIIKLSQTMPLVVLCDGQENDSDDDSEEGAGEWLGVGEHVATEENFEEWQGIEENGGSGGNADHEERDNDEDGNQDHEHDFMSTTPRDVAEMLFKQLRRTRVLQTSLHSTDTPALLPLLDTEAPLLECFQLRVVGPDEPLVVNPFGAAAPPRLTSITLKGGCAISLESPVWTNITDFCLQGDPLAPQREPYQSEGGFADFSRVLSQMPSLTNLSLFFAIPMEITGVQASEVRLINLPRLSRLMIRDVASNCGTFLGTINCQLDTLFVDAFEDEDPTEWDRYVYVYYCIFLTCKVLMAPALEKNELSHVAIDKKYGRLSLKSCGPVVLSNDFEPPLTVYTHYGQLLDSPRVKEKFIACALKMIPPRQSCKLAVELHNIGDLDLSLVAEYLSILDGIRPNEIDLVGHEKQWWLPQDDDLSNGDLKIIEDDGARQGESIEASDRRQEDDQ